MGTSREDMFPPKSLDFPCSHASLLQSSTYFTEYYQLVEAMEKKQKQTEKTKKSKEKKGIFLLSV